MIKPLPGTQDVVSLLDDVVSSRPHLPPLVVVTTSTPRDDARAFLDGYRERLSDIRHRSLVPHAHSNETMLALARGHEQPDVTLLDQLASQFRSTIPAGAGKRWRTRRFTLLLDVVEEAEEIGVVGAEHGRVELADRLHARWAARRPVLSWAHRTAAAAEYPTKLVGLVLSALLVGPTRWWFDRSLDGRWLRWFGPRVAKANGLHADFLDQATWLLPGTGLPDVSSLRRRILFEALLRDLLQLTRRARFLPWRRRRRWTPVLLLDGTDPLAATLVDLFVETTGDWPVAPLLVIAALPPSDVEDKAGEPRTPADTAAALRSFVDSDPPPSAPWLPVELASGATTDVRAANWLGAHLRVVPRVPGPVSAYTPLVASLLVVALVAGLVTFRLLLGGCADTKVNDLGERVGVVESECDFDTGPGGTRLRELAERADVNNAMVDRLNEVDGQGTKPRYYREVVFFGPLTRPGLLPGVTAPANALWQLEGAIAAQAEHNGKAEKDSSLVPIKLVLANSGDHFGDGAWVADRIAERPKTGRGGLAGVIGISQSLEASQKVVRDKLATEFAEIPVVGASVYGKRMVEGNAMFLAAPMNSAFADSIEEWIDKKPHDGSAIVYDPTDSYFSGELRQELVARGIGGSDDIVMVGSKPSQLDDNRVKALCTNADRVVPVLAGRADDIIVLLETASRFPECSGPAKRIRLLAGPGLVVSAASGALTKYGWADIRMTSLAGDPAASDLGTGADAFGFVAKAVAVAHGSAGDEMGPQLVGSVLAGKDFTLDRPNGAIKLNQTTAPGRIKVIDLQ
ncbi:hypothetical protein [Umezawaea sp. NPDC059074]|uniref:hypothetical protein n=1 Tax=Umezawaea sp. NPDC059074 TaxID=3346716 RepID=UPI00367A5E73